MTIKESRISERREYLFGRLRSHVWGLLLGALALGSFLVAGVAEARPTLPDHANYQINLGHNIHVQLPPFGQKVLKSSGGTLKVYGTIDIGSLDLILNSNVLNPNDVFDYQYKITNVTTKLNITGEGDFGKVEVPLAPDLPLGLIPIADTGIFIEPKITFNLGVEGKYLGTIQPTLTSTGAITAGVGVRGNRSAYPIFSDTMTTAFAFNNAQPTTNCNDQPLGAFKSKVYVKLGVEGSIEGLAGPYIAVKIYGEGDVLANWKSPLVPDWPTVQLWHGAEPEVGLRFDWLSQVGLQGALARFLQGEPSQSFQVNILRWRLFEGTPYSSKPPFCDVHVKALCDLWIKNYPRGRCGPPPRPTPVPPPPPPPPSSYYGTAGPNCPHGVNVYTPNNTWYATTEGGYSADGCSGKYLWTYSNGNLPSGDSIDWVFDPGLRSPASCDFSVFVPATRSIVSTAHPAYYQVYGKNFYDIGTAPGRYLGSFAIDQLNSNGWIDSGRYWPVAAGGSLRVVLDDRGPTGHGIAADAVRISCRQGVLPPIPPTPKPIPSPPPGNNQGVYGPGVAGLFSTIGTWFSGGGVGLNGKEIWTYANGTARSSTATWTPMGLDPGIIYQIDAYIPNNHANATHAHYQVKEAVHSYDVYVNQKSYTNAWASLGRFCPIPIGAGVTGKFDVSLFDDGGNRYPLQVGADDIRVIPLGRCTGGI